MPKPTLVRILWLTRSASLLRSSTAQTAWSNWLVVSETQNPITLMMRETLAILDTAPNSMFDLGKGKAAATGAATASGSWSRQERLRTQ